MDCPVAVIVTERVPVGAGGGGTVGSATALM
jgi:hypothetical protein